MLRDWLSDTLSDVRYRFRAVFRRRRVERELEEELRFHLEQEARKLEASGLAPDEAMRRARLSFGGVERIKDDTRDVSGVSWLETFSNDVRYAIRGLRARPAFTTAVVLTLGLGIGANVAMFGIVDQLLLRTPPYLRDADRVHRVYLTSTSSDGRDFTEPNTEYTRYLDSDPLHEDARRDRRIHDAQLRHRHRRGRARAAGRNRDRELLVLLRRASRHRPLLQCARGQRADRLASRRTQLRVLAGAVRRGT